MLEGESLHAEKAHLPFPLLTAFAKVQAATRKLPDPFLIHFSFRQDAFRCLLSKAPWA